jgi:phosphoribosylcarboxyaminoimidazole (NCAIR) mutase
MALRTTSFPRKEKETLLIPPETEHSGISVLMIRTDSIKSSAQESCSGIPVATVAIDGAANAALLAIQILALSEPTLRDKLIEAREAGLNKVLEKNKAVEEKYNK